MREDHRERAGKDGKVFFKLVKYINGILSIPSRTSEWSFENKTDPPKFHFLPHFYPIIRRRDYSQNPIFDSFQIFENTLISYNYIQNTKSKKCKKNIEFRIRKIMKFILK